MSTTDGVDPEAEADEYEVAVVGGGPAGLSAALYTTRLSHDTVVIDRGGGRAAMMLDTHNVIGVPEEISGNEFLQTATEQVKSYGGDVVRDLVTEIERTDDGRFYLSGNSTEIVADRVVLGMGFSDERPEPPLPRTGKGLHYCLHCDAYMFVDEPVYVMGHGESAAKVAMIMLNFTDEVDILTRGYEPEWSEETARQLEAHPIEVFDTDIEAVENGDDGWLDGFVFEDGTYEEYKGGFAMYGSDYNTGLAEQLGVELNDGGTIAVDDHGNTSVDGVYAVGDIVPGHNQIPVAMGQGAKAGIDIHYDLRRFPMSLEEIEESGGIDADDVPAVSEKLRARARAHRENPPGEEASADD